MKIRPGVTQTYYKNLSPDRKLYWKLATWGISLLASWLITKTGYRAFDFIISASCALVTMLMIESQRSYSEYSRKTRKLAVTVAIVMARWGITGLGIVYFAFSVVAALAQTLHDTPSLRKMPAAPQAIFIIVFLCVILIQSIKIFRRLRFEELISKLPSEKLKDLLVKRKFIANNFETFSAFELGVALFSYCYASIVAGIVNVIIKIICA
ncbi:hypothetical protein [Burkholderia ubonensis]|uniref:hypothetical protein n=1 Tax=Burkholderia ubonensis TaxID=101571 RepID=UPI000A5368C1|nr:hypothetical protein [Burkholderia ubonensis]